MNTLTIVVLVACATMAFASAIPGEDLKIAAAAAPEEIFQAEENRYYGHGHGHHHGHYHGFGGHHGFSGHHHGFSGHHHGGHRNYHHHGRR